MNDLLESGASVATMSGAGYTPLHIAAAGGKSQMVRLLLLKGADKDVWGTGGHTPLSLAASLGRQAATLALLAAGADVSRVQNDEWKASVLHVAAQRGDVDIMRAVIEHGADVNAVDTIQRTPLNYAAKSNNVGAIDILVEAGAILEVSEISGNTPLSYAAFYIQPDALLALLKHGAHVNALNNDGQTPLHVAATKAGTLGAAEVVNSLLRSGADEAILDYGDQAAADVVAQEVEGQHQQIELVERVRQLLANAPADRAWRRRGYLVLCRAHPDRVKLLRAISSVPRAQRTRDRAILGSTAAGGCNGETGDTTVDGQIGGDWTGLVARMLVLQEEGVFRTIVGYL